MKVAGQRTQYHQNSIAKQKFLGWVSIFKGKPKEGQRIQYYMSETDFDRKGENSSYQESTGGGG